MKTLKLNGWVVTLIIISLCTSSCHKTKLKGEYSYLEAEWTWLASSGGESGYTYTPATEGYSQKLILYKNGTYKKLKNDSKVESGRVVVEGKTIKFIPHRINFKKHYKTELGYNINNDTLNLWDIGISDGFFQRYIKK